MQDSLFFQLGPWNWFILAALFGALEIVLPGYLLIWYGAAAAMVGAIALGVDLSWQIQLLLYTAIGLVLLLLSLRFASSRTEENDKPLLNRRGDAHIGKTYPLADATSHGRGKVRVGDSLWSVKLEDEADLPAGSNVVITGIEGTLLIGKAK